MRSCGWRSCARLPSCAAAGAAAVAVPRRPARPRRRAGAAGSVRMPRPERQWLRSKSRSQRIAQRRDGRQKSPRPLPTRRSGEACL
eukprot:scaffold128719_cov51-Phaeocystis_antarctica.AAC.3